MTVTLERNFTEFTIKSLKVEIIGEHKLIGAYDSNPYILDYDLFLNQITLGLSDIPQEYSDFSEEAQALLFALFSASRGTNLLEFDFNRDSSFALLEIDDKTKRHSVVPFDLITDSLISIYEDLIFKRKNSIQDKPRFRYLMLTNALRHFGNYLIINYLPFQSEWQRSLISKLYLGHDFDLNRISYRTGDELKKLVNQIATLIIEEIKNAYTTAA